MFKKYFHFMAVMALIICCSNYAAAQYFYKDIWNPKQLATEMAALKEQNVRVVSIKSFETNGEPSENFFCEKRIDRNYKSSETITRSDVTSQSLLTSRFNSKGLITATTDSSQSAVNITEYMYDDSNRIISVKLIARSSDDATGIEEVNKYEYNSDGTVKKMTRLKNNVLYSTVDFKVDEKGNVTEENEVLKNEQGKKYFYYYDDKNHLTDVVHYNENAKRLLPDYMYEYNQRGQIKQMITTEDGRSNYLTWKYTYNDKNLRESERCFSKERKLLGSVVYSYK